jgi:flagellar biosynthetic protein FliP
MHGLSFVPRYDAASPPHLDRVVTPRADDGQWSYQAALDDLARAQGRAAASYAGHALFLLPSPGLPASAGFPFGPLAMAALLGLIGAGAVYGLDHLRRVKIVTKLPLLRQLGGFGLHFAEMAVAMLAGMEVFGALNTFVLVPAGFALFTDLYPQAQLLAMAVSMAAPMVGWMLVRGHGRRHALEMGAAMLIPAVVAIVAGAAGVLQRGEMVMAGHELMWVAMLGLMLVRWNHYAGGQHGRPTSAQPVVRAAQAG